MYRQFICKINTIAVRSSYRAWRLLEMQYVVGTFRKMVMEAKL